MSKQKKPDGPTANGAAPRGRDQPREAAYFLSLSLENVRCFGPRQTLDLSDGHGKPAPWTIILGVNGTGKTTVLQSLAGFAPLDLPLGYGHARFAEQIEYTILAVRTAESADACWEAIVGKSRGITESLLLPSRHRFRLNREFDNMYEPPKLGTACPRNVYAYGSSRRLGSTSFDDSERDDPAGTLYSDRADLRNPEDWLLRLDYAASKPSHIREKREYRLHQAKELLLSVMPDDEITNIRFVSTTGPNPKLRVEFKTPYGWVPLRQLGYGYQTLITWVADLANRMAERYPDSPNPLAEPAVVLVDEIDLHLHPKWQRKLIGFLTERFPNTQFIATAHSPLVVQAAANANLAVLRRESDHVVIDNDVDDIRNWRVDQILTSDLFGLETARPPQIEKKLLERKRILAKGKLTKADEKRVKELEEEIGELPYGETKQERKREELIQEALNHLMKERKPAP